MLLGLNPGHMCDVISVAAVTEFMVDVAGIESGHMCVIQCQFFQGFYTSHRSRHISRRNTDGVTQH